MSNKPAFEGKSNNRENFDINNVHVIGPNSGDVREEIFEQVFAPLVDSEFGDVFALQIRVVSVAVSDLHSLERVVHFDVQGIDFCATPHIVFQMIVEDKLEELPLLSQVHVHVVVLDTEVYKTGSGESEFDVADTD
jgi:hypothetical protein